MSRYNEDEWKRLKEAERTRQKRKYQNKYINDTYERLNEERKQPRGYLKNSHRKPDNFNDIKEIKIKNDNEYGKYIIISLCIIIVMGAGFLFSGLHDNFFYEKAKKDIIKATNGGSDLTRALNKQQIFKKTVKKWKRTEWEEEQGKMCNKGKCTYYIKQHWRDCLIKTGNCNARQYRKIERNYKAKARAKITYF